jgi:hypothetical protein
MGRRSATTLKEVHMETATKQRAKLESIEVKIVPEEYPDLSYLETKYVYEPVGRCPWSGKFTPAELIIESSCRYSNEDVRKYGIKKILSCIRADEDRLRTYEEGVWTMCGIYAEATILIPCGTDGTMKIETIRSGGLYGIESDSGDKYLREIGDEQIAELKSYLETLNVETDGVDTDGWEFS